MLCFSFSVVRSVLRAVPGWQLHLKNYISERDCTDKPTAADLVLSITDVIQQVERRIGAGAAGPRPCSASSREEVSQSNFYAGERQEACARA